MKLFLVGQSANYDYDTYSDFVVCAESEEIARNTHPSGRIIDWENIRNTSYYDWCYQVSDVKVTYLGEADGSVGTGIICSSFHAG